VSNDYWATDLSGDPRPTLVFTFANPTDLDALVVTSGANAPNFATLSRPRSIAIAYSDGTGVQLTLKDDPSASTHVIHARSGTSLSVSILSVYPVAGGTDVALAEIEFRRLR